MDYHKFSKVFYNAEELDQYHAWMQIRQGSFPEDYALADQLGQNLINAMIEAGF